MVVGDEALADYTHKLVETLSHFSLKLTPNIEESQFQPPRRPIHLLSAHLLQLHQHYLCLNKMDFDSQTTFILPTIQFPSIGLNQDSTTTVALLLAMCDSSNYSVTFTSGYLNPTPEFKRALTHPSASCCVITSSMQSNGFYSARGVSGFIPQLYEKIRVDLMKVWQSKIFHAVEYHREGWTYHMKGVWMMPLHAPTPNHPLVMLIGSSNYGMRSVHRDIEFQMMLISTSPEVEQKLAQVACVQLNCDFL